MIKKKGLFYFLVCVLVVLVGRMVYASSSEPGSSEDPLVTLSYVEQRIEQIKYYMDEKFSQMQPSGESRVLEIVELKAGERLIADQGTEIILRGGTAAAIDSPLGGLSDITAAVDIRKDELIQPNHLLIVPRGDGRGVRAISDAIFIIRGTYQIEKD